LSDEEKPRVTLADGTQVYPEHRVLRHDGQQNGYVVLAEEERAKGFIRPVRRSYVHAKCGGKTTMGQTCIETAPRRLPARPVPPQGDPEPARVERVQLVDLELERAPGRDTDRAWCVIVDDEPVWLPRSEAQLDGAVFTLPRWLAVEKGLA
jgi:hypothetical protein